jgi:coenzyme F420-reducing hydrogenase beta subunit
MSGSLQQVVSGGYCIGCGVCAAMDPSITVKFDAVGRLQAELPTEHSPLLSATAACPFSGVGPNEDQLAEWLFTDPAIVPDGRIGRHLACFAGWVEEGDLRARGSSGGIGTWLQCELLDRGMVDAVLNVRASTELGQQPLFSFSVVRSRQEVLTNAKTRYYPIELSEVIAHVINNPGSYAAIATPCFAKALRLAALQSPLLAERLHYVLGIVCGHLKSAAFTEAIAWQCGLDPDAVHGIDFRVKLPDRPATRYGVSISGKRLDGQPDSITRPMEGLLGANWGHGLFKYKACEFCDDVLAETADAVVGDAWLPAYAQDHLGTNVVVVRHPDLLKLLKEAHSADRLHLETLSADEVAASQAGGLRHRRDGLAYRLWLADRAGHWRPEKRVKPSRRHLSPAMRRIHSARYALGQASHVAWRTARQAGDLMVFKAQMMPLINLYERLMHPGFIQRALGWIEGKLDALLFLLGLRR